MKREKLNTLNEKDLLTGLITSDKICRELSPIIEPRLLEVDYARIVSSWVKEFYSNFKKAPGKDIIKIYRAKCDSIKDEALQDNVLTFIEKLSKDYENQKNFNDEFVLQESIKYLKCRQLQNLNDDVNAYLSNGDVQKAENAITKFKTVEKSSGKAVSILHSTEAVAKAFTEDNEVILRLPGAYGTVIGDFHREDFISFLAPMKRGKTWQLIDVGVESAKVGLKVFHVSCEMSESQNTKRYWTAMSGQVSEDKDDIDYPYFEKLDTDSKKCWTVKHKKISRKAVSVEEVEKKQKALRRLFRGGDIRIFAVPAYSLTVEQLDIELDRLQQQEGYAPDIILIDYADIMAPSEKGDYRNQLDGIWKRLRGLAQKRKCVVVTASQSGRASIGKDANEQDIAEDIRKLAHVTSMVSLNQSRLEKQNGILRLKQLAVREGEQEFRQAVCTQCLSIGRIILDSRFDDETIIDLKNPSEEDFGEDDEENEEEEYKPKRTSGKGKKKWS